MSTFYVSDGNNWLKVGSDTFIELSELKSVVAASTDFADFKARVAAL